MLVPKEQYSSLLAMSSCKGPICMSCHYVKVKPIKHTLTGTTVYYPRTDILGVCVELPTLHPVRTWQHPYTSQQQHHRVYYTTVLGPSQKRISLHAGTQMEGLSLLSHNLYHVTASDLCYSIMRNDFWVMKIMSEYYKYNSDKKAECEPTRITSFH